MINRNKNIDSNRIIFNLTNLLNLKIIVDFLLIVYCYEL